MSKYIVLDIETAPLPFGEVEHLAPKRPKGQELEEWQVDARRVKLADQYAKEETVENHLKKWIDKETAKLNPTDEEWKATLDKWMSDAALDPGRSRVCAVGIREDGEKPQILIAGENGFESSYLLQSAIEVLASGLTIVGHNIKRFDIPYLIRSAVINLGGRQGIPPVWELRNRSFDTLEEWLCGLRFHESSWPAEIAGGSKSLDYICKLVGLPTKPDGMTGATFHESDLESQRRYLEHDITVAEELARLMGLESSSSFGKLAGLEAHTFAEDGGEDFEDPFA